MLTNIEKPMIQVYGKTNFINGIQIHNRSPWFKPMAIHSKPNSYWQYQSPILISNIKSQFSLTLLYQKEKSPRLSTLGKEKISFYRSKKGPWQSSYEETHWELSWGLCSHIMNPWNIWTSFCITTSIIYTFYTCGKRFKPTSSSSKLLETWTLQYGIHHSKCYLQKCFETCPIVSNITTNCPKAHCKYLWRNSKKCLLIKIHEE